MRTNEKIMSLKQTARTKIWETELAAYMNLRRVTTCN